MITSSTEILSIISQEKSLSEKIKSNLADLNKLPISLQAKSYSDILKYSYKSKPLYSKSAYNSTNLTNSRINTNRPFTLIVIEHLAKPENNKNFISYLIILKLTPTQLNVFPLSRTMLISLSFRIAAKDNLLNNKNRKTIKVEYPNISLDYL